MTVPVRTVLIYSYNPFSKGAKYLAKSLKIKRVKHQGSRLVGRPSTLVINWGSTSPPQEVGRCSVLNSPTRVAFATNKLKFFTVGSRHARLPGFCTSMEEARELLTNGPICARQLLSSSGGRGVVYIESPDQLVSAPLYTQYVPKMSEFRLHIFKGEIIDIQRKARRTSVRDDSVDWKIRNLDNGFVYVRQDVTCPKDCRDQAVKAFNWTGLDFGAVDVIWNQKKKEAYVLEINTAPGIEATTLENYSKAISNYIEEKRDV